MLASNGMCMNFGVSSAPTVTFDLRSFYLKGSTSLHGFYLFEELEHQPASEGLARWRLVETGQLRPHISLEESWEHIGDIAQQLAERRFAGKAVLRVTPGI